MVYIFLGNGFEEIEAIAPLDILRRADVETVTVSMTANCLVRGGHGLVAKADITLEQVDFEAMEMLVLPGGGGGVASIADTPAAMDLILRAWKAEKLIAAICAAPSLLAAPGIGILDGKRVVCHPVVIEKVSAAGGNLQHELSVISDHNLITGKAAGSSIEFGLELVAALRGREVSEEMRRAIFYCQTKRESRRTCAT
jgi:4-methyl-5(b-hydroxyethyl)-thiazole monophosphate biosynthesis